MQPLQKLRDKLEYFEPKTQASYVKLKGRKLQYMNGKSYYLGEYDVIAHLIVFRDKNQTVGVSLEPAENYFRAMVPTEKAFSALTQKEIKLFRRDYEITSATSGDRPRYSETL